MVGPADVAHNGKDGPEGYSFKGRELGLHYLGEVSCQAQWLKLDCASYP